MSRLEIIGMVAALVAVTISVVTLVFLVSIMYDFVTVMIFFLELWSRVPA